ncbi:MAG: hypothetical protein K2X66_04565 [Cyanobacteria bacterium]|nr:hypothetical protein [Cyanobacteriota bacterium]
MSQASQAPTPLQATERDSTLNPRQLRSAGFLPATLYGRNIASQSIQVKSLDFTRLYHKGAREFAFEGLGEKIVARAHQLQIDSISQEVLSLEFLQLSPLGAESGSKKRANKNQSKKTQREANQQDHVLAQV